jgi:hypothetical protein
MEKLLQLLILGKPMKSFPFSMMEHAFRLQTRREAEERPRKSVIIIHRVDLLLIMCRRLWMR